MKLALVISVALMLTACAGGKPIDLDQYAESQAGMAEPGSMGASDDGGGSGAGGASDGDGAP